MLKSNLSRRALLRLGGASVVGLALSRVEHLRTGLPDAVAEAADQATGSFAADAHRVAAAVAKQSHLHVPGLPHARR